MRDDALAKALEQQDAATAAMLTGDPRPYIDSWAVSEDTSVFGAWGPIEKGHKRVTDLALGRKPLHRRRCRGRGAHCHRFQRRSGLYGRLRAQPCQRRRRAAARHGDPGHPYLPAHRRRLEARPPARRLPAPGSAKYRRRISGQHPHHGPPDPPRSPYGPL